MGPSRSTLFQIEELQADFAIDAYLASDLATIYVDAAAYRARSPNRYRFSLAHELAHLILHREVFQMIVFKTVEEWIEAIAGIPKGDHAWIEWQAYSFAGLVLVPPDELESRFEPAASKVRQAGLRTNPPSDAARLVIAKHLADVFVVSSAVIEKRIEKDALWRVR